MNDNSYNRTDRLSCQARNQLGSRGVSRGSSGSGVAWSAPGAGVTESPLARGWRPFRLFVGMGRGSGVAETVGLDVGVADKVGPAVAVAVIEIGAHPFAARVLLYSTSVVTSKSHRY